MATIGRAQKVDNAIYCRIQRCPEKKENFTALELHGNLLQTRQGGIRVASSGAGRAALGADRESLQFQVALSSPSIYVFPLGPVLGGLALRFTA